MLRRYPIQARDQLHPLVIPNTSAIPRFPPAPCVTA